jgi:hypothetical protein
MRSAMAKITKEKSEAMSRQGIKSLPWETAFKKWPIAANFAGIAKNLTTIHGLASSHRAKFCVGGEIWKALISKPGPWANPAILTPVDNGIISRGVK